MARLLSSRVLIVVAVVILLAGAVLLGLDLSGVFSADQVRTTDQPMPAPIPGNGPTGPMHRLWSVRTTGLAPDGGQVLTSTTTHDLTALDVHTGAVRWSDQRSADWRLWGVAIADSVVVADFEGPRGVSLVGLDETHGTKLWSDDGLTFGPDEFVPWRLDVSVVAGDTIYADSISDDQVTTLVALDPHTGDKRWQTSLGANCLVGGPALMAGPLGIVQAMTCGSGDDLTDRTVLVDPSGHIRWQRDVRPSHVEDDSDLVLGMGPGTVVVQLFDGPWIAYSATGDVVEQCACAAPTIIQPSNTVADGLVLDTGVRSNVQHQTVTAYDASTGRQRWTSDAGQDYDVLASGSRVFYHTPSVTDPLAEVDPATGAVRATYPLTGISLDSTAVPPTTTISTAAIDGGAYLVWQGLDNPQELSAYAG